MVNHPDWEQFRGGDSVALTQTARAVRALGVDVTECHDPAPDAVGFDIAHVFNLRTFEDTAGQTEALQRSGVPIVLTPFYIPTAYAEWAALALQAVLANAPTTPSGTTCSPRTGAGRSTWPSRTAGS